jgi:hypothetical protein
MLAVGIGHELPGTAQCALSLVARPSEARRARARRQITLKNHEREHAYGPADLRLLTTVGCHAWERSAGKRPPLRRDASACSRRPRPATPNWR